jgi:hypothetical protein
VTRVTSCVCGKVAQNVAQPIFCQNSQPFARRKQSTHGRKFAQSEVDVMITIFCDFRQFLAKKFAFFSKTNVMIKILHKLALF